MVSAASEKRLCCTMQFLPTTWAEATAFAFCIGANVSGSIWIILGNMQCWSATNTGDGQVDVACCRINSYRVRFMANRIVAQFFKVSVGLIKDRDATTTADKHNV